MHDHVQIETTDVATSLDVGRFNVGILTATFEVDMARMHCGDRQICMHSSDEMMCLIYICCLGSTL